MSPDCQLTKDTKRTVHTASAYPPKTASNPCLHPQVNGVCVEGKQHGDVVSAIKAGGDETKLLVVDKETDEFFKKCGVIPSQEHLTGKPLEAPKSRMLASALDFPCPGQGVVRLLLMSSLPSFRGGQKHRLGKRGLMSGEEVGMAVGF